VRRLRPLELQPATYAPFAVVFVAYVVYLRAFADPHFYWDGAAYWSLGGSFGGAGHFSLLDYDSTIRGYALPLFNRLLASIASSLGVGNVTIVQLFGALEVAVLGTLLIPALVRASWPAARVTPWRILLLNGLIFFFWRDYFGYPMSDFPAATLAIAGLYAATRRSPLGYALAGLALGLAWNVRQAYIATLVVVLVIAGARAGFRRAPRRLLRNVGLVLVGLLVASAPQMLINHHHGFGWSLTVPDAKVIALINLSAGMQEQRYETYIGTAYPSPGVRYLDPSTQAILREDHIASFTSYTQYARVVERHPTEMVASWWRHIFNGLDVRFATPYIRDLNGASELFSLIVYSLIFVAGARLLIPSFRRQFGKVSWPEGLALAAGIVPAIPLGAETRYYIPVQLIVYALVLFAPGTRQGWAELGRPGKVTLMTLYPVFLLFCIALSTATLALIEYPT
jgi:hypothetical protein